jgi:hypothetical protein
MVRNDGLVSACCREQTGGVCIAPPGSIPTPAPTATEGTETGGPCFLFLGVTIPGIGTASVTLCIPRILDAGQCKEDRDCASGMFCRILEDRGVCVEGAAPQ